MDLDVIDREILGVLLTDGRISMRALGDRVGLGASATTERVRRLEAGGAIRGYRAVLDPEVVGLSVDAIIEVQLGPDQSFFELDEALNRLAAIDAALARSTGWYFDLDRHDDPALADLVPEEWITNYAVVGTPAQVADQLAAIADLGFTSASLNLAAVLRADMATGLRETIDGFATVIDEIRS